MTTLLTADDVMDSILVTSVTVHSESDSNSLMMANSNEVRPWADACLAVSRDAALARMLALSTRASSGGAVSRPLCAVLITSDFGMGSI